MMYYEFAQSSYDPNANPITVIRSHMVNRRELPPRTTAHDGSVATPVSYSTNRPVEVVAKH